MEIFQENGLFGLKNDRGEVIITPQYIEFDPFSCGLARVRNLRYEYAYIDVNNRAIIPFGKYIWLDYKFICGYARVKLLDNEHWALIDTTGEIISQTHYTSIWGINEQYLPRIKAFRGNKRDDVIIDNTSEIILDGIKYIKTYSIEEFKELFNCSIVFVNKSKEGQLYFQYGVNIGQVAKRCIPTNPVISIVTNSNGRLFALLHDKSSMLQSYYVKDKPVEQKEKTSIKVPSSYQTYDYEEERDYIESSYLDAFEGDESNYWNID